jgi:zinc protease
LPLIRPFGHLLPARRGECDVREATVFFALAATADKGRIITCCDPNTSLDRTIYHTTFAKEDLPKILEIEADRFKHLAYTPEAFKTEARAVLGEYNKNSANPLSRLDEAQANAAFTTHTYKHTTMGFIKDIEDMPNQYEYSKDFFSRSYRPEKATMFVVGDVKPDQVFPLVEKYWGDWKRGNFVADIPKEPQANGPVYEHVAWPTPTSPWVTVAFHGPAFLDLKHQTAIDTAFDIEFGETSEIYKRLVEDEQKVDRLFTDGRSTRSSLSRPRASDFGGFDFPRPEARGPRPA